MFSSNYFKGLLDQYIATESLTFSLISLVKRLLVKHLNFIASSQNLASEKPNLEAEELSKEKLTSDGILAEISQKSSEEIPYSEIDQFLAKITEAEWRINFIRSFPFFQGISVPFFNVFLSSPKSLLVTCVRLRDWHRARDVINFFKLRPEISEIATRAEAYHVARRQLEIIASGKQNLSEVSLDFLVPSDASVYTKFLVCMDVALVLAANGAQSKALLKMVPFFSSTF